LVPGNNELQPGLESSNWLVHYAKIYAKHTDDAGYPYYYLVVPGAGYTTWAGTTNGIQNAQVFDNSISPLVTLGIGSTYSLSGSITNTTATFTHSDTDFARLIPNTKVKIRGASGVTTPFVITVSSSSNVGFTGAVSTTGTYRTTATYSVGDYVEYLSQVYYMYNQAPTSNIVPSNTTYWRKLSGSITGGTADPIINNWNLFLETSLFEQEANPVPAGTTSYSAANVDKKINNYTYNDKIVNQKQTLFTTGEYIIHDGFPFDKDSITGASVNITAGILPSAVTAVTTRPTALTTNAANLPSSDNRWIAYPSSFSGFTYPTNANYVWSSWNGSTSRNLQVFNDASKTYLPDMLSGTSSDNPSSISQMLKLATPDASNPPLTDTYSLSFKKNDLMYQSTNPFKIDGTNSNSFTTLMVVYPDYVPSAVMNSTVSGEETNWYGIMSQAKQTGTLATDIANWNSYYEKHPRLSVRYKINGVVGLYLGDALLTAIKPRNGVSRPFQPMIIGLTISATDDSATLIVVDSEVHKSTVKYTKNWLAATPETPNTILYGAVPFASNLHSSKMYVLEINHYYSDHDDAFFNSEIQKMDKMYAVTNGRVS
jgi:hypothetical protein